MKAAVCFDGIDDAALAEAVSPAVRAFDNVEAWCAYADAAQQLLDRIVERHHGPPQPPHRRHGPSLDEEQAQGVAARAIALLARHGISAAARIIKGENPERALAEASAQDVVLVLAAGHRGGIGPRSVGHVARFVVDHARGPVLVMRLYEPAG
ncbi:MAG TPA: universal stress protein [Candidatus Dormibacteraeota bacterium]|nr:universal stress protein [Candidatus Dormibacteraeota bacterium]